MHSYLMLVDDDDDDDDDDVRYTSGVCQFRLFQDIVSLCNKISRCRSKVQQLIPFGNVVHAFFFLVVAPLVNSCSVSSQRWRHNQHRNFDPKTQVKRLV